MADSCRVAVLLQPRDYINGLQLFVGLIILYGAIVLLNPAMIAPMFNIDVPAGTPSMVPLLFVTIACGAISGFHGLVSSGTTSKQLNREPDARFVGYFGAIGEGGLARLQPADVHGGAPRPGVVGVLFAQVARLGPGA